ncbi:MAG: zinc ribbon domain-containing protein [Clostridia bacterium]|nr:zinc ribbon domain-containing protein [Clostridia bacterium]
MYCKSCGKELSDNTLVCPFCETPTKIQQKKTGSTKTLAVILSALIIGIVITAVITDGFGLFRKDTGEESPTESSTHATDPSRPTELIV